MSDIHVFIGSSKESLKNAEIIKSCLEPECECTIWDNNFFDSGCSTYSELAQKAILFDYAVFVGGKDDTVLRNSTGDVRSNVRDNVYLEFGLYAGILTPKRTFFVIDRLCKPASDLRGITLFLYKNKAELRGVCEQIEAEIQKEEGSARFSMLPSTSLAYGYFENYVQPAARKLHMLEVLEVDGVVYNTKNMRKRLAVVIPKDVKGDWGSKAQMFYNGDNMKEVGLGGEIRELRLFLDNDLLKNGSIKLYDIPTTMRISFAVVDQVLAGNNLSITEDNELAREKEVRNFVRTFNILKERCPYCSKYVTVKYSSL